MSATTTAPETGTAERTPNPFLDISGRVADKPRPWKPLLVTREEIEAEVARLCALPAPANGRRAATIVHPAMAARGDTGFTPATKVTLSVLLPGERTLPRRENANLIEIAIAGGGQVVAGDESFTVTTQDVWNLAPMRPYAHSNTGSEPWARLTFSNETLLERLGTFFAEEGDAIGSEESEARPTESEGAAASTYVRETAPDHAIGNEGARLRGYEFLTDIDHIEAKSLVWPWSQIEPHVSESPEDGRRHIWLMYNPITERRAGTSNSFFATWAVMPPGMPPFPEARGHRHVSASLNYHFAGSGRSVVDGEIVDWKGGDLLFSAPSWSEHIHYPGPDGWKILTIQDHPMHIALGSLLWQEKMDGHIYALGLEPGQTGYTAPREMGR